MWADVNYGCPAWFSLLHPHSLLDTKGVLAVLGGGDSTKVLGTNPLHWELIHSEFSDIFEKQSNSLERTTKHNIDLLPNSVLPAKR